MKVTPRLFWDLFLKSLYGLEGKPVLSAQLLHDRGMEKWTCLLLYVPADDEDLESQKMVNKLIDEFHIEIGNTECYTTQANRAAYLVELIAQEALPA